jgi:hypothetical protein
MRITIASTGVLFSIACATGEPSAPTPPPPPPPPPPAPVATVTVTLGNGAITVGLTTQASAVLKSAAGTELSGRTIAWASSAVDVATVSSTGLVTGTGVGTATITAISEGQTGSTSLTVNPLPTVFEGQITGVLPAEVETACKATSLPNPNDWYYVIRQLERLMVSRTFSKPWPGRKSGDVHARQEETFGKLRFSCTPKNRDASTGTQFVVELGQQEAPIVTVDVMVCEDDGSGGSRATTINTGQLGCPYNFGDLFPAVTDFFAAGPFQTVEQIEGPTCTIHRPTTLGAEGRRHPILLWGNGITLGPEMYRALLKHFASHGFVVAATDTTREGTGANGQALLACLGYLETQNTTPGSVYENKLNVYRVGAAGHSAGGGGVIMAGRDPRIGVTAPIQPALATLHGYVPGAAGQQKGPMFLTSGDKDTVIAVTTPPAIFGAVNTPAIWAERIGSGHGDPLFDAPNYRRPVTAWLRYHLMLDNGGRVWFYGPSCVLCGSPVWRVQQKNGI